MSDINILLASNRNYFPQVKVLLRSLFLNNAEHRITVFLLHSEFSKKNISVLNGIVKKYGGKFYAYFVKDEHRNISDISPYFPPEAFYRLFSMYYLPDDVGRVLYLDVDIVINGSLKQLFDTEMNVIADDGTLKSYLFGAAKDLIETLCEDDEAFVETKERINMPLTKTYVNSGVLLINLEELRQRITTDELIRITSEYRDIIRYPDQDILNMLFHDDILLLNHKLYNYNPIFFKSIRRVTPGNPVIIHFSSYYKPWKPDFPQKTELHITAKELYDKYAAMDE